MKVIAKNLNFRNKRFQDAVAAGDWTLVENLARELKNAGSDIININLSLDGDGDEKSMGKVVAAVSRAGLPISIDSRNAKAHREAVKATEGELILNYVSDDPSYRKVSDEIIRIAADGGTDLVLYATRGGTPADADERLQALYTIMEKTMDAGIPNARLIVDPVILHLGGGVGQQHALAVQQTLVGMNELVDPPLRTTCWLSNISMGAPRPLRPHINATYLSMLAGLGLWSAYIDVFDAETMRAVRLIRALNNEAVYTMLDAA